MTSEEFEEKFLNMFANNISDKVRKKNKIGKKYGGYLWYIFSQNLYPCFEGIKAKNEYDCVDKTNAFEIQYDNGFIGDRQTNFLYDVHLTAKGIDEDELFEFYVIGEDFSWCYVVTHERDLCGPYFCYA